MMLDAEKWAKNKGFDAAYVWSINHEFYKKCEYSEIESDGYCSLMKKEL